MLPQNSISLLNCGQYPGQKSRRSESVAITWRAPCTCWEVLGLCVLTVSVTGLMCHSAKVNSHLLLHGARKTLKKLCLIEISLPWLFVSFIFNSQRIYMTTQSSLIPDPHFFFGLFFCHAKYVISAAFIVKKRLYEFWYLGGKFSYLWLHILDTFQSSHYELLILFSFLTLWILKKISKKYQIKFPMEFEVILEK